MQKRFVDYGTEHPVTVERADDKVIVATGDDNNEGYVLIYHGLKILPKPGDKGKVVFERDIREGHWQFYSN